MIGDAYFVSLEDGKPVPDKQVFRAKITVDRTTDLVFQWVNFYFEAGGPPIFKVPLEVPRGLAVNENNWFSFLEYSLRPENTYRVESRLIPICGIKSLRIDFCGKFMYFETISGPSGTDYAMVIDTGDTYNRANIYPRVLPFLCPDGDIAKLTISEEGGGLTVHHTDPNKPNVVNSVSLYEIQFKNPLSAETILKSMIAGKRSFEITPDMCEDIQSLSEQEKAERKLVWMIYGDFHYLKTYDGKYSIATQKNAVYLAMGGCMDLLDRSSDMRRDIYENGLRKAFISQDPVRSILKHCTWFLENYSY